MRQRVIPPDYRIQRLRHMDCGGPIDNLTSEGFMGVHSTYVLIAIVKKELHLDASLSTLLQILSVPVFENRDLMRLAARVHTPGNAAIRQPIEFVRNLT